MVEFFMAALAGPDGKASMCKCMGWSTLVCLLISWFILPERSITELAAVLGGILAYGYGGKVSWNKNNPGANTKSNEDILMFQRWLKDKKRDNEMGGIITNNLWELYDHSYSKETKNEATDYSKVPGDKLPFSPY